MHAAGKGGCQARGEREERCEVCAGEAAVGGGVEAEKEAATVSCRRLQERDLTGKEGR
jgi:hypothetical protein